MANDNDKKENGIKRLMKRCAEVWKILLGVVVVFGLIGSFYGLDAVIATEKDLDIYKKEVTSEMNNLEESFLASFRQFQQQQQLDWWNQRYREYLDRETDFKYRLKKDPNNPDLKSQYEHWRNKRVEAQKEIDKLTKPPTPPGG